MHHPSCSVQLGWSHFATSGNAFNMIDFVIFVQNRLTKIVAKEDPTQDPPNAATEHTQNSVCFVDKADLCVHAFEFLERGIVINGSVRRTEIVVDDLLDFQFGAKARPC